MKKISPKLAGKLFLERLIIAYFTARNWKPLWLNVLNRKPRNLYLSDLPALNDTQKNIVAELRATGIAVSHLSELFPQENWLLKLQEYSKNIIDSRTDEAKHKAKSFLEPLWPDDPDIDFNNPFLQLTFRPEIGKIINSYLDMYTKFYYFTLNITKAVEEGAAAQISQKWHRDPEDRKMCKIFIYLNDVDEGTGPFTYVTRSTYGLKYGKFFPQRPPRGVYPKPGELESKINANDIKVCTAKAGTVIFADTAGLHKGGYATKKDRLMFTAGFRSSASPWKFHFNYPKDFDEQVRKQNLTPAARYALEVHYPKVSTLILYGGLKKLFSK